MKCGIKTPTKLSPTKFSPTKSSPSKLKPKESPTKYEHDPCKGHEFSPKPDTSVEHLFPSRDSFVLEDRPVNNKENLLHRLSAVDTSDLECSPLQDSGYSSVLLSDSQSQDEEDFGTSLTSNRLFETPKQQDSQEKIAAAHQSILLLPVIRFEEAVCSTLKKGGKRCPKLYWDSVKEVVSNQAFALDRLIGRKMGLERMDILGELFKRDFKHLLSQILRHLSAIDLINVISVSTTWQKILQEDKWAYSVYKRCHRKICEQEARKEEHTATRDSSLFRIPLSSVQKVASAVCCVSKKKSTKKIKPCPSHSRYSEFIQVGRTLVNDQSLKVCIVCSSPAKYDSYQHRAQCTRDSCQLDFCTLCNCKYHFSKDCATNKAPNHRFLSEPLPGSKKSKQNLGRL
ncbi:LOW QUALITY PROTEIN: F-box only protein 5 [Anomaloglossus baeobatrachus]|uniref:LOW QUALITY PROTEIN: F-box only protein 5 n=1 Tax=Anomaloglossus baeobatrachus TaxID=238106 RepID=UPI003F50682A